MKVRTKFNGVVDIDYESARKYVAWKLKAMTTEEGDEERLKIINEQFVDVVFKLSDL